MRTCGELFHVCENRWRCRYRNGIDARPFRCSDDELRVRKQIDMAVRVMQD